MPHDVFISYSFKDKTIADAVCAILESKRIRCWIAPRDVLPGENYGSAIIHAIDSSKIMVFVFSGYANDSPDISNELDRAVKNDLIIIPFRIEAIEPSYTLQYYIGSRNWLDAITPPLEKHLNHLAETAQIFLNNSGKKNFIIDSRAIKPPMDIKKVKILEKCYKIPIKNVKNLEKYYSKLSESGLLFLIDRSSLGTQLVDLCRERITSNVFSISFGLVKQLDIPEDVTFSVIIIVLGEDFNIPLSRQIIDKIIVNTNKGGGLILFPFTAWSVNNYLNADLQKVIPVFFNKDWFEEKKQDLLKKEQHSITKDLKKFNILNTYERLYLKSDARCLVEDSEGIPLLAVSRFGKGKVAYLNISSYSHNKEDLPISPLKQKKELEKLILNTIKWALQKDN